MIRNAIFLCFLALAGSNPALPQDVERVLARVATYEHGQTREPLIEFDALVRNASRAQLPGIEKRLLEFLHSGVTPAAQEFALRQLSLIGTQASVSALAALLLQPGASEMARYALERIPSPAADEALRKALPKTSGKVRIGIVHSLGRRGDARAVASLKTLAGSADPAVARAAISALGKIGGPQAARTLEQARAKAADSMKAQVLEAYLKCAERFALSGDRVAALRIYTQLSAAGEPRMIRVAALGGLAKTSGREAVPVLADELRSPDRLVQAAAIAFLQGIPGQEAGLALSAAFPNLPPAAQVMTLSALAGRGDTAARPLMVEAVKAGTPEVRAAALAGLGRTGDRSSVMLLAEAAATRQGAEREAARESLYRLRGPEIDPAIVGGIGSAGKGRVELIRAAGERGIALAAPALLASARDADREVRRESLRALRDTAGIDHAQALLDLLLAAPAASERREAGRTLASILKRSGRPALGPVIAAYQAAGSVAVRASLLEVMGQVAAADVLPVIRSGLKQPEREISRAAILALSDWPAPDPLPDLLAVAKTDANPANQVLALRGYIKLLSLPAGRPAGESARLLGDAMSLAKQAEEKKAVLALLPSYPSKEALQVAETVLNDASVAGEAKMAVERITRALASKR